MSKEKIAKEGEYKIEGLPEKGLGKRISGEVLVLLADDSEGVPYTIYAAYGLVADRKTIVQQVKLEVLAREKQGQVVKNFRLTRMSENEAVEKGILPGIDRVDIPARDDL